MKTKASSVVGEFNLLVSWIAALEDKIDVIQESLEPFLSPAKPAAEEAGVAPSQTCDFHGQLQVQVRIVHAALERLGEIHDRLQV